jgi:hypothetical protein
VGGGECFIVVVRGWVSGDLAVGCVQREGPGGGRDGDDATLSIHVTAKDVQACAAHRESIPFSIRLPSPQAAALVARYWYAHS